MSSSMRQPEHGDSSSFVVHVQYGGATKDIELGLNGLEPAAVTSAFDLAETSLLQLYDASVEESIDFSTVRPDQTIVLVVKRRSLRKTSDVSLDSNAASPSYDMSAVFRDFESVGDSLSVIESPISGTTLLKDGDSESQFTASTLSINSGREEVPVVDADFELPHDVTIQRGPEGFGFQCRHLVVSRSRTVSMGSRAESDKRSSTEVTRLTLTDDVDVLAARASQEQQIFIKSVTPEGPAADAGVGLGDHLLAVNGIPAVGQSISQVEQLIEASGDSVTLSLSAVHKEAMQARAIELLEDCDEVDSEAIRNRSKKLASFFGDQVLDDESVQGVVKEPIAIQGPLVRKMLLGPDGRKQYKRSWRSVYGVVRGQVLYFYNSANNTKSNRPSAGRVSLKSCICDIKYTKKRKHVFRLITFVGGEYLLQAEDEASMMKWIATLQHLSQQDVVEEQHHALIKRKATSTFGSRNSETGSSNSLRQKLSATNLLPRFRRRSSTDMTNSSSNADFLNMSIESMCDKYGTRVPLLITKCAEEVERRGLDVEGVYRLAPSHSAVKALKDAFCQDPVLLNLSDTSQWDDIHAICGVLKSYIRDIEEPVLTVAAYDTFIAHAREDKDRRVDLFKSTVQQLPPAHLTTLRYLIRHLQRVGENSGVNKMACRNLAIVFGPTLVRSGADDVSSMVGDMSSQCTIVETLIGHFETIFEASQPDVPPSPGLAKVPEYGESEEEDDSSSRATTPNDTLNESDARGDEGNDTIMSLPDIGPTNTDQEVAAARQRASWMLSEFDRVAAQISQGLAPTVLPNRSPTRPSAEQPETQQDEGEVSSPSPQAPPKTKFHSPERSSSTHSEEATISKEATVKAAEAPKQGVKDINPVPMSPTPAADAAQQLLKQKRELVDISQRLPRSASPISLYEDGSDIDEQASVSSKQRETSGVPHRTRTYVEREPVRSSRHSHSSQRSSRSHSHEAPQVRDGQRIALHREQRRSHQSSDRPSRMSMYDVDARTGRPRVSNAREPERYRLARSRSSDDYHVHHSSRTRHEFPDYRMSSRSGSSEELSRRSREPSRHGSSEDFRERFRSSRSSSFDSRHSHSSRHRGSDDHLRYHRGPEDYHCHAADGRISYHRSSEDLTGFMRPRSNSFNQALGRRSMEDPGSYHRAHDGHGSSRRFSSHSSSGSRSRYRSNSFSSTGSGRLEVRGRAYDDRRRGSSVDTSSSGSGSRRNSAVSEADQAAAAHMMRRMPGPETVI